MNRWFYASKEYRDKQSDITKRNWLQGKFDSLKKPNVQLTCLNHKCQKTFYVVSHDSRRRQYCSSSCSAIVNNKGRIVSEETRLKKSLIMKGRQLLNPRPLLPRTEVNCSNPNCQKIMYLPPWLARRAKYCSVICSIGVIGHLTTSPKASKGKPGVRYDISPEICFYSTWEANIARVFSLINLNWQYSPKIFDLGEHTYRPDFYLPEFDTFVEVKNFMGTYSLERDSLFRQKYPNHKLDLILKEDYKVIENNYKDLITNWE